MNIVLWIAQGLLALLCLSGGAFKVFKFDDVAMTPFYAALPRYGWSIVGAFEMACAVLLVAPVAFKGMPSVAPLAATLIVLESLALAALYARHSLQVTATNPLPWSVATGVLALFVAYGRYAIRPLT